MKIDGEHHPWWNHCFIKVKSASSFTTSLCLARSLITKLTAKLMPRRLPVKYTDAPQNEALFWTSQFIIHQSAASILYLKIKHHRHHSRRLPLRLFIGNSQTGKRASGVLSPWNHHSTDSPSRLVGPVSASRQLTLYSTGSFAYLSSQYGNLWG